MTYIDELASWLHIYVDPESPFEIDLYRIYAVLALAKGTATTREDVHNAWSAWMSGRAPRHPSLAPFSALPPEVQALDQPYVDAIHAAGDAMVPA